MTKRLKASCVQAAEAKGQHTLAGMQQTAALPHFDLDISQRRNYKTYKLCCIVLTSKACTTADCIGYLPHCSCCLLSAKQSVEY